MLRQDETTFGNQTWHTKRLRMRARRRRIASRRVMEATAVTALFVLGVVPSEAAEFTANNDASFRQAIQNANADPTPPTSIRLTGDITLDPATLPTIERSLTINTDSFTLSAQDGASGGGDGSRIVLPASTGITVSVTGQAGGFVTGGDGGFGIGTGIPGLGGTGGEGMNISGSGVDLTNSARISGGNGGDAEETGGGAGTGVSLQANDLTNTGTITGGNGGSGASGGGTGGLGVFLNSGVLKNTGTITGGNGGNGGTSFGGSGNSGVFGNSLTVINSGTISGGDGGSGPNVASIQGGTGVVGNFVTVINSGTISGGLNGDGSRANAVIFSGGTNRLELRAGSVINGNVRATGGSEDTFALGGNANSSFDVSTIGDAAQYRGFESFEKTGNSIWTLTGTTAAQTPWTIKKGTLSVSSDGNLGSASSPLTIDGGTLRNTAAFTTARNITLNVGGGTFETQADLTASGVISGIGTLTKAGDGTLTLTGNNIHTGGALLRAGTLSISSDANLGNTTGGLIFDGGTLQNTAAVTMGRDIVLNAPGGTFETQADLTANSVIAGIGSLTKTGDANMILSNANNYTGGTTVSAGTLTATVTGALGTGPVDVLSGAELNFINSASAESLSIANQAGTLTFRDASSAGSSTINNLGGSTNFANSSSASDATIINDGGGTSFSGNATAGNANITNNNGGPLNFYDTATAGNATIFNGLNGFTIFNGDNTADGATIINRASGTVNIAPLTSGGIAIGSLSGGGSVILGSKTLTLGGLGLDDTIVGVIQDGIDFSGGSLVKIGARTLTLMGNNTYTGTTTVGAGTLLVNGSIATSPVTVNGGILGGTGIVGPTTLAAGGTIAPGNSIGTLLVDGNYAGNGGTLEVETNLAGGSADRLLINGNATGTTQVSVQNQGGPGPATGNGNTDGLSIIQVGGNSQADAFQLAGGYAAVGPYRYELNAFNPNASAGTELDPRLADRGATQYWDYRLQPVLADNPDPPDPGTPNPPGPGNPDPPGPTNPTPPGPGDLNPPSEPNPPARPVLVPQIPVYQAVSPAALQYGWALFDNLHQRLGEIHHVADVRGSDDAGEGVESFFRARGRNGEFDGDHGPDFEQDLWFLQAGANLVGWDMRDTGDSLRLGMAFSYGSSNIGVEQPGVTNGAMAFDAPSLALTGTYQGAGGWYLDTVLQGNYYDIEASTAARGRVADFNGAGLGASVEAGVPFVIAPLLILEPQAQLAYQRNWFDDFTDVDGVATDVHDGDGLRGRVGGRLQKTFESGDDDAPRLWSPYLSANVAQGFLSDGGLIAGGVGFDTDTSSTALLFGTGLNAQIGERWGLYSNATYIEGLAEGGVNYAWAGNGGVRLNF